LVSIPKVQPRFAIAIGKKYPTMKSLLSVYMDPSKSVNINNMFLSLIDLVANKLSPSIELILFFRSILHCSISVPLVSPWKLNGFFVHIVLIHFLRG